MTWRYMKRCSVSSVIKEMQMKSKMTYHLTPKKMTVKQNRTKQVLAREWRNWNPHTLAGIQNGANTLKNDLEGP